MSADHRLAPAPAELANRASSAFLCFHSVHPQGPPFLSIPPERFAAQLGALRARGFVSGSTATLDRLAAGERLERPHAFLTFDDGYADNVTLAWPLLQAAGLRPLIFLLPDQMGGPLAWPEIDAIAADYPDVMRAMTWEQAEALAEHGAEFGSHGIRHAHLPELADEALAQELLDSRRAIAQRLGRCDLLAYPFGEWDLRVALAAGRAGYRYAMSLSSTRPEMSTALSIPRVCVDHRDLGWRLRTKTQRPGRVVLLSPVTSRARSSLRRFARD